MLVLTYDPTFAKRNTCFLLADGCSLRCRITTEDSGEAIETYVLEYRKKGQGSVNVRPLGPDLDHWMADGPPAVEGAPRIAFEIESVPPWVADALKML